MSQTLYSVDLPYAKGGVVVDENRRVIITPPIFAWARGMLLEGFTAWIELKRGTVKKVTEVSDGRTQT
jgi:hypothetical protein